MIRVHQQIGEIKTKLKIKLKIKRKLNPAELTSTKNRQKQIQNLNKTPLSMADIL